MESFRTNSVTGVARVAGDALELPWQQKLPWHSKSPAQLLKVAASGSSRDRQSGHCTGKVTPDRSSSGPAVSGPVSRTTIQASLAAADVIRLGRRGVTSAWITTVSLGRTGDEPGQDADPPAHAVRARDVLQLDRLGVLPSALRTCRNDVVAYGDAVLWWRMWPTEK
jgi:hypothetical protein